MYKTQEVSSIVFISDIAPSIVLNPCKKSFNLPSSFISTKFPSILCFFLFPVVFMWRYQFNFQFLQFIIQFVAIVCLIANNPFGHLRYHPSMNNILNIFLLMSICCSGPYGERKTRSVCNRHDLCPLTSFSFSNTRAPFFALAKVPSIKHSVISILPRFFKS